MELPIFPLHAVLVPGARLPLKVFETRYVDMVSNCLKNAEPFGICLIKSGREVGAAAVPQNIGTLAHIESCEMPQQGILMLQVRGGQRFAVKDTKLQANWSSAMWNCGRMNRISKSPAATKTWWSY